MPLPVAICPWHVSLHVSRFIHALPHVADSDASGEYFDYSIDELGLQDIRAADRVISNVVCNELASS